MSLNERFRRVATTIGKLYESQLLHRDLSYSNLIATNQGPRIIDWRTLQQTGGNKQVCCLQCFVRAANLGSVLLVHEQIINWGLSSLTHFCILGLFEKIKSMMAIHTRLSTLVPSGRCIAFSVVLVTKLVHGV